MPRPLNTVGFEKTRHIPTLMYLLVQAMIAAQGYYEFLNGLRDGTDLNASAV